MTMTEGVNMEAERDDTHIEQHGDGDVNVVNDPVTQEPDAGGAEDAPEQEEGE